jgi:hypothetical protein
MQEKVYITYDALTKGIVCANAEVCGSNHEDISVHIPYSLYVKYYKKGDWFRTKEEAVARAEAMRKKRIALINRQLEKLSKLDYNVICDRTVS